MSQTAKTVVWVVAGLVVLVGGWMLLAKPDNTSIPAYTATTQTPQTQTQTATTNESASTVSNSSNTSDASVNSDVSSIDAQMKSLNADSTASASSSDAQ